MISGQTILLRFEVLRQPLDDHNQTANGFWVVRPVGGGEEMVINEESMDTEISNLKQRLIDANNQGIAAMRELEEVREVLAWASKNVRSVYSPEEFEHGWMVNLPFKCFDRATLYEALLAAWRERKT